MSSESYSSDQPDEDELEESDLDDIPLTMNYESRYLDDSEAAGGGSQPATASTSRSSFSLGLSQLPPTHDLSDAPPTRASSSSTSTPNDPTPAPQLSLTQAAATPVSKPPLPSLALGLHKLPNTAEHSVSDPSPTTRDRSGTMQQQPPPPQASQQQASSFSSPPLSMPTTSATTPSPIGPHIQPLPAHTPRLNIPTQPPRIPTLAVPIPSPPLPGTPTTSAQPASTALPTSSTFSAAAVSHLLSSTSQTSVSLLCPAFTLPTPPDPTLHPPTHTASSQAPGHNHAAASTSEAGGRPHGLQVQDRIAASLGVPAHLLKCFVLQGVAWEQLTPDSLSLQVAVLVDGSSFSLAALEDMLQQNKGLHAAHKESTWTSTRLKAEQQAATASVEDHAFRLAAMDLELQNFKDRVKLLEGERQELRHQLQQCDEQRWRFRSTLTALRQEFELSQRQMEAVAAVGGSEAAVLPQQPAAKAEPQNSRGVQGAGSGGMSSQASKGGGVVPGTRIPQHQQGPSQQLPPQEQQQLVTELRQLLLSGREHEG